MERIKCVFKIIQTLTFDEIIEALPSALKSLSFLAPPVRSSLTLLFPRALVGLGSPFSVGKAAQRTGLSHRHPA